MIFRWLLRRSSQRRLKRLVLPEAYERFVATGHWDWISEMSEWRAFRLLYFPMNVGREIDPQHLRELQQMIGKVLADTDQKKDESKTSA